MPKWDKLRRSKYISSETALAYSRATQSQLFARSETVHVDIKTKTIFFHNPKTAGRSTIMSLGLPDDVHMKLVHFGPAEAQRCIFQESWEDFFTFTFVRNPWDRMVSLYEYHRSVEYARFQRANASHQFARQYDFDDWVYLNEQKIRQAHWYGVPQTHWMEGVSSVYRFEDYQTAFAEISTRMGLKVRALHLNQTRHKTYRSYYKRKETIETVGSIDAYIIDQFDYNF